MDITCVREESEIPEGSLKPSEIGSKNNEEKNLKNIFKHLGLWNRKERPPPKATGPPKVWEYDIDCSISQILCFPDAVSDEAGLEFDKWLYDAPEYPETFPD